MTAPVTVGTQKSWVVALLLCFFVGFLGVHRFYVGKVGTASSSWSPSVASGSGP